MLIEFAMPRSGLVRLDVFDLTGHLVRNLADGLAGAGLNAVPWDGRGEHGRGLPPGTYFLRLRSAERVANKKVVLFH